MGLVVGETGLYRRHDVRAETPRSPAGQINLQGREVWQTGRVLHHNLAV